MISRLTMIRTTSWMHSDLTAIKATPRKKRLRFGPTKKSNSSVFTPTVSALVHSREAKNKTKQCFTKRRLSASGTSVFVQPSFRISYLCFPFPLSCDLRSEPPQRARTRLDEILESLTSPRLLERPATGELKDQLQSQEKQQQEKTGVKGNRSSTAVFRFLHKELNS